MGIMLDAHFSNLFSLHLHLTAFGTCQHYLMLGRIHRQYLCDDFIGPNGF